MRMEVHQEQRTVDVYTFFAEDGKPFASAHVCKAYEAELREKKAKDAMKNVQSFSVYPPDADMDYEYKWYLVENSEQLEAIKAIHFYDPDASAHGFEPKEYPALIRVDVCGDTGCGCIAEYEDVLSEAESYLDSLQDLGEALNYTDEESVKEDD